MDKKITDKGYLSVVYLLLLAVILLYFLIRVQFHSL
jgi:hypothetical protein